ncbi:type II secretion system protein GspJ [Acinetobacter chinensis]|uniref:Type II secretion system protein J n=1 Tax=Acinetobacter chinensis TaxID=2004650 RepID=A0A3B7LWY2_9GAMM|nr:type II secretion system minor pseudopilin GspJ [Acinetobacter chinensis]AXY56921.1 type II secretion system protein GspJ [Acinetobacter chinensis]
MSRSKGFTLVELLVAIAIFAVLSALGWKVFDYLSKVSERNEMHEANLSALQEAHQQILRDSLQIAPLTANIKGETAPALILQNGVLIFSKTGVTDPLAQGTPPDERVEYRYRADEKKLYRLKYSYLNQTGQEQPVSSVLLENVEQYDVSVLNPAELKSWPEATADAENVQQKALLPRGIMLSLTVQGISYQWLYSLLNTDFLKQEAVK